MTDGFGGHRKNHRNRLELIDDHQAGIGRSDHVARIDHPDSGDAADRRGDRGKVELGPGGFDRCLIGQDRGLQSGDLEFLRVERLPRRKALLREAGDALEIGVRVVELRLVLGQVGLGLMQRRQEWPGVDVRQFVAGVDKLPLREDDVADLAAHARFDSHAVEGLNRAEPGHIDRYVLGFGLCGLYAENCSGGRRRWRAGGGCLVMDGGVSAIAGAAKKRQDHDDPQPMILWSRQGDGGAAYLVANVLCKRSVGHRSPIHRMV